MLKRKDYLEHVQWRDFLVKEDELELLQQTHQLREYVQETSINFVWDHTFENNNPTKFNPYFEFAILTGNYALIDFFIVQHPESIPAEQNWMETLDRSYSRDNIFSIRVRELMVRKNLAVLDAIAVNSDRLRYRENKMRVMLSLADTTETSNAVESAYKSFCNLLEFYPDFPDENLVEVIMIMRNQQSKAFLFINAEAIVDLMLPLRNAEMLSEMIKVTNDPSLQTKILSRWPEFTYTEIDDELFPSNEYNSFFLQEQFKLLVEKTDCLSYPLDVIRFIDKHKDKPEFFRNLLLIRTQFVTDLLFSKSKLIVSALLLIPGIQPFDFRESLPDDQLEILRTQVPLTYNVFAAEVEELAIQTMNLPLPPNLQNQINVLLNYYLDSSANCQLLRKFLMHHVVGQESIQLTPTVISKLTNKLLELEDSELLRTSIQIPSVVSSIPGGIMTAQAILARPVAPQAPSTNSNPAPVAPEAETLCRTLLELIEEAENNDDPTELIEFFEEHPDAAIYNNYLLPRHTIFIILHYLMSNPNETVLRAFLSIPELAMTGIGPYNESMYVFFQHYFSDEWPEAMCILEEMTIPAVESEEMPVIELKVRTLLQAAILGDISLVRQCIAKFGNDKVRLNFPDLFSKKTALHLAVYYGHPLVVRELVAAKNCDINAVDADGNSAYMLAAADNRSDLIDILEEHEQLNKVLKNKEHKNAAMLAEANGHFELASTLARLILDLESRAQRIEENRVQRINIQSDASLTERIKNLGKLDDFPEVFFDEVSNEIMTQPIGLPDGTTLDHSTIRNTIAAGSNKNPLTNVQFPPNVLRHKPNILLQKIILQKVEEFERLYAKKDSDDDDNESSVVQPQEPRPQRADRM